jgi:hypothetical protein
VRLVLHPHTALSAWAVHEPVAWERVGVLIPARHTANHCPSAPPSRNISSISSTSTADGFPSNQRRRLSPVRVCHRLSVGCCGQKRDCPQQHKSCSSRDRLVFNRIAARGLLAGTATTLMHRRPTNHSTHTHAAGAVTALSLNQTPLQYQTTPHISSHVLWLEALVGVGVALRHVVVVLLLVPLVVSVLPVALPPTSRVSRLHSSHTLHTRFHIYKRCLVRLMPEWVPWS